MRIVFFLALLVVAVAVGCEDSGSGETALEKYNKQLGIDTVLIDNYLAENGIIAMRDTISAGLRYVIHEEGDGKSPKLNAKVPGDCFKTAYLGKVLVGDIPFDSSISYSTSLTPQSIGKFDIIAGWKIGFPYLKEGDSATLYIPSGLAYGSVGSGSRIPANSVIYFHVRLQSVCTPEYNPAAGRFECYYDDF